jgi:hypothetical protein
MSNAASTRTTRAGGKHLMPYVNHCKKEIYS